MHELDVRVKRRLARGSARMTAARPARRKSWRQAWVFTVEMPRGREGQFPALTDGQVLAVEWRNMRRDEIEPALRVLFQSHVLSDDSDRFDFAVRESYFTVSGNASNRHFDIGNGGLPTITARFSMVRLVDGTLEFKPEPWPEGKGPEDYKLT